MENLGISRDVKFYAFGEKSLTAILGLEPLPFARKKDPFRQLQYIAGYVGDLVRDYAPTMEDGERRGTLVCETHYIDRDYIEDHSVFYSRNLFPYKNYCRRLHFFCLDQATLKARLRAVVEAARLGKEPYREACRKFSTDAYLGFCVIKPLDGCPVGRTVLRTYPRELGGFRREFHSTRKYHTHLLGVELCVEGLAFQQQDAGVAACATTAVWSSLHHLRGFEDVAAATPAQITGLASRNDLPFGRPMPSEGLSLGQMCQAIQAIGVSPSLLRVEDYRTARAYIYSASMSGMAPILVIANKSTRHAVTVAGVKTFGAADRDVIAGIADTSFSLQALYAHDDRVGPYCKGLFGTWRDIPNEEGIALDELEKSMPSNWSSDEKLFQRRLRELLRSAEERQEAKGKPTLILGRDEPQLWRVTHVLLAMHPKIRLSFKGLYEAGVEVAKRAQRLITAFFKFPSQTIALETRIMRGSKYVEDLMFGEGPVKENVVEEFSSVVVLPRYLGVLRLSNQTIGTLDILLDTTGTPRNLHALAVVAREIQTGYTRASVRFLAKELKAIPIL